MRQCVSFLRSANTVTRIGFLTLAILLVQVTGLSFLKPAAAQTLEQETARERIAIETARVEALRDESVRHEAALNELRTELRLEVSANRDRLAELSNRISTITGIGVGLSAIVMVLQLIQMAVGARVGIRKTFQRVTDEHS